MGVESMVESRFPPHTNPSGRQTLFAGTHKLFWWQPAKSFEKGFDGDALIIFFMIESRCRMVMHLTISSSPETLWGLTKMMAQDSANCVRRSAPSFLQSPDPSCSPQRVRMMAQISQSRGAEK